MIEVYDNTVIYIYCPSMLSTGGPNSLHQLCYKLRFFGYNAYICYYHFNDPLPDGSETHPNYLCYNNPVEQNAEDTAENIVIVPEAVTSVLPFYENIRKAIWWLSVDFYYGIWRELIRTQRGHTCFDIHSPYDCYHFADSVYAKKHLELFSIDDDKIMMLESYLHPSYTQNVLSKAKTGNNVTYNPGKGMEFTKQIIDFCQANGCEHINFIPLAKMTYEEMAQTYIKSKLHIDFGGFPGREYIPREAVIYDMCIITGKKGASKYHGDVPIPDKYKIAARKENLPLIAERIKDCVDNYNERVADFAEYKAFAIGLEETFERQIRENFRKVPPDKFAAV